MEGSSLQLTVLRKHVGVVPGDMVWSAERAAGERGGGLGRMYLRPAVGSALLRKVLITDMKSNSACLGSVMLHKNIFPLASGSGWGWRFLCPLGVCLGPRQVLAVTCV